MLKILIFAISMISFSGASLAISGNNFSAVNEACSFTGATKTTATGLVLFCDGSKYVSAQNNIYSSTSATMTCPAPDVKLLTVTNYDTQTNPVVTYLTSACPATTSYAGYHYQPYVCGRYWRWGWHSRVCNRVIYHCAANGTRTVKDYTNLCSRR